MPRQSWAWLLVAAVLLASLFQPRVQTVCTALFRGPWERLFGDRELERTAVLETSSPAQTVNAAARRLVQPFGVLRLVEAHADPVEIRPNAAAENVPAATAAAAPTPTPRR